MSERVFVEQVDDGIVELRLQDVENRNAFTAPFVDAILDGLRAVAAAGDARVCLVTGLPEVFCAGAHEELLADLAAGRLAAADIVLSKALLDLPIPTVAAMEGHAVGGGLVFGLCCDLVVLARESRYGCTFMNMGFTPGMGTTGLLDDAVGPYLAGEMMFGGQLFRGAQLEGRARVNGIWPRAEVRGRALDLARRMAEKPRFALAQLKAALSIRRRQAFEHARTVEALMHQVCFDQPDTARRIRENYARPSREGT